MLTILLILIVVALVLYLPTSPPAYSQAVLFLKIALVVVRLLYLFLGGGWSNLVNLQGARG